MVYAHMQMLQMCVYVCYGLGLFGESWRKSSNCAHWMYKSDKF